MITRKQFTSKMVGKQLEVLMYDGLRDRIRIDNVGFEAEDVTLGNKSFFYRISIRAAEDLYSKGSCMYRGDSYVLKRRTNK